MAFGDTITPGPLEIEYPVLLDFPAPKLLAYNRETVVAEKFQAMVYLGMANSRMKDLFDVWSLARTFAFNGQPLSAAIAATFQRRKTDLPAETPLALSEEFADDRTKQTQWAAFVRKGSLDAGGLDLKAVLNEMGNFLLPPLNALRDAGQFSGRWYPGGPAWFAAH